MIAFAAQCKGFLRECPEGATSAELEANVDAGVPSSNLKQVNDTSGSSNNEGHNHLGYKLSLFQDEEAVFYATIISLACIAACTRLSGPGKQLLKQLHAQMLASTLGIPHHLWYVIILMARVAVKDNMTSRSTTCDMMLKLAEKQVFPAMRPNHMRSLISCYFGDTACIGGISQYAKSVGIDSHIATGMVGIACGTAEMIKEYLPHLAKTINCMPDVLVGLVSAAWCLPHNLGPLFSKLQLDSAVWTGILAMSSGDVSKARYYGSGLFARLKFTDKVGLNVVGLVHGSHTVLKELIWASQCPDCEFDMLEPAHVFAQFMQPIPPMLNSKMVSDPAPYSCLYNYTRCADRQGCLSPGYKCNASWGDGRCGIKHAHRNTVLADGAVECTWFHDLDASTMLQDSFDQATSAGTEMPQHNMVTAFVAFAGTKGVYGLL